MAWKAHKEWLWVVFYSEVYLTFCEFQKKQKMNGAKKLVW